MLMPPLTVAYSHVSEKIMFLINLMELETDKYDQAASRIENRHTRDSVRLLVQQTKQYTRELQSLTEMLGRERSRATQRTEKENQEIALFVEVSTSDNK